MRDHWRRHPGVRSNADLTFGERSADRMRNGFGTWKFLGIFCGIMVLWIISGGFGFDASPFFRLNLALSCLAGLQGAIILLAAKRADKISSEIALHTERNTEDLKTLIAQNTELTSTVHTLAKAMHDHIIGVDVT